MGWTPPEELVAELAAREEGETVPETILQIENAKTYYKVPSKKLIGGEKQYVKAVDDVSFKVKKGQTLGVVGESGCGKSTLVKTIIGMEKPTDGEFEFMGIDISGPVNKRDLSIIQELQMVFQNPDSTLNPSFTVGNQIGRPLKRFKTVPNDQVRDEVVRLLGMMRLGERYYDRLPRQLSGGEKQRVGIARAIAGRPELVLCDEPVSALDVSVQAAVLNLLMEIQQEMDTTMIFIAHDLSVVRFFCDYIAVMYLGQISRDRPRRRHLCAALPSLHRSPAVGRAHPRPQCGAEAHPPERQRAQRPESTQRLPLPHPLPAPGRDAARWRQDLRRRGAALAI